MATQMPGLMPPEMLEQQQLGGEQQMLIKALQAQMGGLMPDPASTGRFQVLNLSGLTNAMRAKKTQEDLENSRKKSADLTGRYQANLIQELMKYDSSSPETIRAARMSPYPEVRAMAEGDEKTYNERFNKLAERASFTSAQGARGNIGKLAPKQGRQLHNGTVIDMTEGQDPRRVAGGWTPQRMPNGSLIQTNQLTGEVDIPDKAPKVTTHVSAGMKGEEAFLKESASDLVKRSSEMRVNVPKQLSALDRAAANIQQGIYQGPTGKIRQNVVGLFNDLGLTSGQTQEILKRTEAVNADIGQFVSAAIQALGANPSNADREYAIQTAGGQPLSQAGALAVINAAKQDIAAMVRAHNVHVQNVSKAFPSASMAAIEIPGLGNVPANPPVAPPTGGGPSIDDLLKKYGGR